MLILRTNTRGQLVKLTILGLVSFIGYAVFAHLTGQLLENLWVALK